MLDEPSLPEGIASRSLGVERLQCWLSKLLVSVRLEEVGSSLKFCRIAEGRADIYPRLGRVCQWDAAAAQLVLEESGGVVVDFNASAWSYGLNRPMLNPSFVAAGFSLDFDWLGLEHLLGC